MLTYRINTINEMLCAAVSKVIAVNVAGRASNRFWKKSKVWGRVVDRRCYAASAACSAWSGQGWMNLLV